MLIAVSDSSKRTFGCETAHNNHLHVYAYYH